MKCEYTSLCALYKEDVKIRKSCNDLESLNNPRYNCIPRFLYSEVTELTVKINRLEKDIFKEKKKIIR